MKTPDGPLALMSRRASLRCLAGCTLGLTVGAAGAQARSDKARAWFTDTTLIDQDHRPHAFYSDLLAPRAVLINAAFVGCSSACPFDCWSRPS